MRAIRLRSSYAVRVAAIGAVYFVSAKLGLTLGFVAEQVTAALDSARA